MANTPTTGRTKNSIRRSVAMALLGVLLITSCSSDSGGSADPAASTTTLKGATISTPTSSPGDPVTASSGNGRFGLKLSEGTSPAVAADPVLVVSGTPLDQLSVDEIFARLPEWRDDGSLTAPFAFPAQTLPPPRTGATIDIPFPNPDSLAPPEVPAGPLKVLRYQPQGDVAVAPFVTVTFNQPMVPLTTLAQLEPESIPATITPEIPGRWQWIGTSTLRFDADSELIDRLPMATKYHVEIPNGTVSQTGGILGETVSWDFATPAVTVQSFQPAGDSGSFIPLEQIFVAGFDQRVDPAAVLATVTMTAGDNKVELRLATAAEIEADEAARSMVKAFPEARSLAFRSVNPLPTDTAITIEIGPGTPSAEGTLTTTAASTHRTHTYAPLKVVRADCPGCYPGSSLAIEFNNTLDTTRFDPTLVSIEPAIPNAVIGASGNYLIINGSTLGRTTYTVTVAAGLTDIFGQTLGQDSINEFAIGSAAPALNQFSQPLTTLDPFDTKQTLNITTINHSDVHVRVFQVAPSDFGRYVQWLQESFNDQNWKGTVPEWVALSDSVITVASKQDQVTETGIDLSGALAGKPGHVVVIVETTETYPLDSNEYWMNRPTVTWAQSTSIGLDAIADTDEMLIWATELTTGAPITGASVELVGSGQTVVTAADGLITAPLSDTVITSLVATRGADTAIVSNAYFGGGWSLGQQFDESRWYVFDDRQTYRPGETVSVKGWVRKLTTASDAQIALFGNGVTVEYNAYDPQGNEIATGTTAVNLLGGFDLTVDLPAAANLGYAYINLRLIGPVGLGYSEYSHSFQIQEFRRPEFEVTARVDSPQPQLSRDPATVAVAATYYAGGPLAAAPVSWTVTTAQSSYSPPNRSDYSFGEWTPWWYGDQFSGGQFGGGRGFNVDYSYPGSYLGDGCCFPPGSEADVEQFSGITDADGNHYLQIDFQEPQGGFPDLPVTVTAQSSVQDVNRQTWSGTTNLLVHPGAFYVGLRSDRTFVRQGEPLEIQAIVTDIDGEAVVGREFAVTASRQESQFVNGQWTQVEVDIQTCNTVSAADGVTCTFDSSAGGTFTIRSIVADDNGGKSRSTLTRWVSGADAVPNRDVQQEVLTIIPDRAEYTPGTSAELLIQAPFTAGEGLAAISRNGITSSIRFSVVDGAAIIQVPIAETDIPNVDVSIEVVGATGRTNDDGTTATNSPQRPAFAAGTLTLSIPPTARALSVAVTPQATATVPGEDTSVGIAVTDANGNPVANAELAVVVVDEAVLSLSGYTLADPLETFYAQLPSYLNSLYGRSTVVLSQAGPLDEQNTTTIGAPSATDAASAELSQDAAPSPASAPAEGLRSAAFDKAAVSGGAASIDVRANFDALAVFAPSVTTDAAGNATVLVPLPDNLTRYRVMVVAAAGTNQFGSGESTITARLPLMVRPSAPRFLNFGDVFELPMIVQNQTDQPMEVDVALQTINLTNTGAAGQRVTVPANDRVEVRFAISAEQAGAARFRVAAVSGDAADAAVVDLPVYTPATAEAFATYGVIDGDGGGGAISQPLVAPTDVIPQFGGLEITTSSTSLQALTDAVLYIVDYKYASSDALASQILSVAALSDVLDAFDADGLPNTDKLKASVTQNIAALAALQNSDGGFGYWRADDRSDPYNTVHAAHALVVARANGYTVPESPLQAALFYLSDIESRVNNWGPESNDFLSAYALHVRSLAGERDSNKAQALYGNRGAEMQLDALALLWPLIDDAAADAEIERRLANSAVETAGAVNFATSYGDDAYLTLNSDRRTDGIILDALIAKRPQSELIPKIVTGLLGNQVKGRWNNIQENTFILLALRRYFDTYEAASPDFVAKVWLGEQFAGEQAFAGRSTDRNRIGIPTAELIAAGDANIVVSKEGTGRLYYRLGLRYAPSSLQLDPLDRGFVVQRSYEGVDDPADVTQDADGTWRIKAGARVRVKLSMVAQSQRTHVALIDPLPAGMEILNPGLAITEAIPSEIPTESDFARTYWWGQWFDHQNMRDDRAEAFSSLLPAGVYDYSYIARATTPGTFVTPPTRAEEMYAPETFGRSHTDKVVIG